MARAQQRHMSLCHVALPSSTRIALLGQRTSMKRCNISQKRRKNRCIARAQEQEFQGVYGPWKVEQSDLVEVWMYRVCISILTASCVVESLHHSLVAPISLPVDDGTVCLAGIAALGIALQQIHMYVTPLKRMLQFFWLLGTLGYGYVSRISGCR